MSDPEDRPRDGAARGESEDTGDYASDERSDSDAAPQESAGRSADPAARPNAWEERAERGGDSESDAGDLEEQLDDNQDTAQASPRRSLLDESGLERPAFLLNYPADPQLEELITAFEKGNYAFVRRHAARVAENAQDAAVRDAALELAERIEPDPLAKYLLWISLGLLVFLILWAYRGQAS